jgi:hypothetical protein
MLYQLLTCFSICYIATPSAEIILAFFTGVYDTTGKYLKKFVRLSL